MSPTLARPADRQFRQCRSMVKASPKLRRNQFASNSVKPNNSSGKSMPRSPLRGLLGEAGLLLACMMAVSSSGGGTVRAASEPEFALGTTSAQRARLARLRDERENRDGAGRMTAEERKLVAIRAAEVRRAAETARPHATPPVCAIPRRPPADAGSPRLLAAAARTLLLRDRRAATSGQSAPESVSNSSTGAPETSAELRTSSEPRRPAPTAKPVPDRPGLVISPFAPEEGYVDVRGLTPGMEVRDPFSGRIFIVP